MCVDGGKAGGEASGGRVDREEYVVLGGEKKEEETINGGGDKNRIVF